MRNIPVTLFYLLITTSLVMGQTAPADAIAASEAAWPPWLAGGLIGVLAWFTFAVSNQPIGASTAYATSGGLIGRLLAPGHTQSLPYYQENPPKVNWELVFVGFTVVGAVLAAWTGGEFTGRWLPPLWTERFGAGSFWLRGIMGFAGGALMAFGARLAGGCTSGHGISGALQLNVASWLALICFFIGGVITAHLIY